MLQEGKIKILQCIRQGQIGGGESHLLSLMENLDRTIYDPLVLSFTDGPMIDRLKEMKVRTSVIHSEKPFDFTVWKQVKNLLVKEKIVLIHCHGTRAASNVFMPARSLHIPFIYSIHGWSFHDDQNVLVKRIRMVSENFLITKSAVNIAVSESNRLTGKKNLSNFEAVVINNGIDQQKFNASKEYKNIRQEIGVNASDILVVFIARFTAHKQPLSLIRSFAEVCKKLPTIQLLMVGEGDEQKEAIDIVTKNDLTDKVHFLPFRQDVPDLLAAADIFVLPSLWEGLPIGLLEAMSMGKAVIATNVDGTREIIRNNENGILIETKDLVKNLTEAILQLAVDKNARQKFSAEARKTVAENFNAATMTRKIENVYARILGVQEPLLQKINDHGI